MADKLEVLKELLDIDVDSVKRIASADDEDGLCAQKLLRATYDFSVDAGDVGAITLGQWLPDNAIITKCWYDVVTAPTSDGSATIALSILSANDLQTATAYDNAIFNAGEHVCATGASDDETGTTFVKLTAQKELTLTVGTAALTAGKIVFFVEYVVSA